MEESLPRCIRLPHCAVYHVFSRRAWSPGRLGFPLFTARMADGYRSQRSPTVRYPKPLFNRVLMVEQAEQERTETVFFDS